MRLYDATSCQQKKPAPGIVARRLAEGPTAPDREELMRAKERTVLMQAVLAAGILSLSLAATFNAASAQDKTYVMKITLPTLNDTIHQVAKNYAAALEKDSAGRIKVQIYPASQLGSIPRQIEGVQFGAIQCAMIPPEFFVGVDDRFQLMAAPGLVELDAARSAPRPRPRGSQADAFLGRPQRIARRRSVYGNPVIRHFQNADPPSRRFQRQKNPHLRVKIPERGVRAARRDAGGDDARRRIACAAAGRD